MDDISREVIERAKEGDIVAFRAIVETYQKPIFTTVFRMVGSRHGQDLEDIVQDIFVKIHRSIDKFDFDRGTKFSTWLFTFVRNHCFDILKKRRLPVQALGGPADSTPALLNVSDAGPHPAERLLNAELAVAIENAVASLPREQRLAFILREYQMLAYAEIADIMECSEGTVKSRLYRAKDSLRASLRRYLEP